MMEVTIHYRGHQLTVLIQRARQSGTKKFIEWAYQYPQEFLRQYGFTKFIKRHQTLMGISLSQRSQEMDNARDQVRIHALRHLSASFVYKGEDAQAGRK